jgi:hypothetical protein
MSILLTNPVTHETDLKASVGVFPFLSGQQIIGEALVNNAITDIYTVPANKVFCLCGINVIPDISASPCAVYLISSSGNTIYVFYHHDNTSIVLIRPVVEKFWPPLELKSNYILRVSANNPGSTIRCSFHGYVSDVS